MKAYLLTATTAFALGAGTVELVDLNEVNAKTITLNRTVEVDLTEAQTSEIEGAIGSILCGAIKAEFGMTRCPADALRKRGYSTRYPEERGGRLQTVAVNIDALMTVTAAEPE